MLILLLLVLGPTLLLAASFGIAWPLVRYGRRNLDAWRNESNSLKKLCYVALFLAIVGIGIGFVVLGWFVNVVFASVFPGAARRIFRVADDPDPALSGPAGRWHPFQSHRARLIGGRYREPDRHVAAFLRAPWNRLAPLPGSAESDKGLTPPLSEQMTRLE